tara:strand:- start:306 stop:494 length:189 start_codon:yes stop_codon:yes gene_type:complete
MEHNSDSLRKEINSMYIKKNDNGIFEVVRFETLKQRQKYLLSMKEFKELKMYKTYTKSFIGI